MVKQRRHFKYILYTTHIHIPRRSYRDARSANFPPIPFSLKSQPIRDNVLSGLWGISHLPTTPPEVKGHYNRSPWQRNCNTLSHGAYTVKRCLWLYPSEIDMGLSQRMRQENRQVKPQRTGRGELSYIVTYSLEQLNKF